LSSLPQINSWQNKGFYILNDEVSYHVIPTGSASAATMQYGAVRCAVHQASGQIDIGKKSYILTLTVYRPHLGLMSLAGAVSRKDTE
jgi:predicted phage-related endonuclease